MNATRAASHVRVAAYDAVGKLDLIRESDNVNARRMAVRPTLAAEVPNGATMTLRVDRSIGKSNNYENGTCSQAYKVRHSFGMGFY